jgi:hypothetical protein
MTMTERDMLIAERRELEADLRPGALDWLGVVERSLWRKAVLERLEEIEQEIAALRPARTQRLAHR